MIKADLIIKGNAVFDGLGEQPFKGGVAIKGNKILASGSDAVIKKYIGTNTEILEYGDGLIMPGFIDAHVHYFSGAIFASKYVCRDIEDSTSETDCVERIKKFAEDHPEEKRIIGFGWFPAKWGDAPLPTKHSLDEAIPDRPVYLLCADVHTMWLNTKALEESGISKDMHPESGEIGVDSSGELNGLLFEPDAFKPAMEKVMDFEKEKMIQIHKDFLSYLASYGVTTISDMTGDDYTETTTRMYDILQEMENNRELTVRIHGYTRLGTYTDFSKALELRKKFSSEKVRHNGVKGFIDGVTSTYTGLLLEPYSDRPDTTGIGVPTYPIEKIKAAVLAANKAGLSVRLHCIADGSVRMALDIFESSKKMGYVNPSIRNTIEHIENIHPADIPRFAELGVIPSIQPYHLTLDCNEKISRIGRERCKWEWASRSLVDSGARLAIGTDCPVVDINPFKTIYAALTRCDDEGNPTGINPEERLTLSQILCAYTAGSANAYGRLEDLGTLEAGKLADIVVIDRNLFAIEPMEIRKAQVKVTIMDGKIVFNRENF